MSERHRKAFIVAILLGLALAFTATYLYLDAALATPSS